MHPLRRSAALLLSVLVLQLMLVGGRIPCDGAAAGVASAAGMMADMPMGEHADDDCSGSASGSGCSSSGSGMDCQAMISCAPAIGVEVLRNAAAAALRHVPPDGHLLHALSRATTPEPPPPRA